MLCHHLWGFPGRFPDYEIPHALEIFGFSICRLCVSIFLFISGYGLMASAKNKNITFGNTWGRIVKTYKMYWKIFAIFIPIGFLMNIWHWDTIDFISNVFAISWTYNQEWWFLSMYIELLVLFPLVTVIKDSRAWIAFFALTLVGSKIVCYLFGNTSPTYLPYQHIYHICYYWGTFMVGIACARFDLISSLKGWIPLNGGGKAICLLFIAGILMALRKILDMPILTIVVIPILASAIVCIPHKDWWVRPMDFVGKHSMNMWLTHSFVCYYYWQEVLMQLRNPIIVFVVLFSISLLFSIIIEYMFQLLDSLLSKITRK